MTRLSTRGAAVDTAAHGHHSSFAWRGTWIPEAKQPTTERAGRQCACGMSSNQFPSTADFRAHRLVCA